MGDLNRELVSILIDLFILYQKILLYSMHNELGILWEFRHFLLANHWLTTQSNISTYIIAERWILIGC